MNVHNVGHEMYVVVGYKNPCHVQAGKPTNHYDLENVVGLVFTNTGWCFCRIARTLI